LDSFGNLGFGDDLVLGIIPPILLFDSGADLDVPTNNGTRARSTSVHTIKMITHLSSEGLCIGVPASPYILILSQSFDVPTEEREMPVHLYGDVHLQKKNHGWELASLRIDKSLGADGAYEELLQASETCSWSREQP
jgi:hypothetical protein